MVSRDVLHRLHSAFVHLPKSFRFALVARVSMLALAANCSTPLGKL